MSETNNLLEIKNLTVHYETSDGVVEAVTDLNLSLGAGQTLGLVGETGAGKTTSVKAVMRILPVPPAKILSGEIFFEGEDLLLKPQKHMREIRGEKISMIFQDPMTSLNPVMTVGDQIAEAVLLHNKVHKKEAEERAMKMLEMVGIRRERAKMTELLGAGFTDTFRHLYPDLEGAYSWWSYRANARERNVGWRIDYFLCSDRVAGKIQKAFICPEITGSDHCPVGLDIAW